MTDNTTAQQIGLLFADQLDLGMPPFDEDLQRAGLIDSLLLVRLLALLEQEFGMSISIEDLDLDDFRSINAIAAFVDARTGHGNEVVKPLASPP